MHTTTHSSDGASHMEQLPQRWAALVLLCFAQFMLIVDLMVVQVALPSIGADLHVGREALTWVVTAYILCFGGLMLLGGRLADTLGARRMLLLGLAVFTIASLLCGLAESGAMLIGGRAAQGVGAALLSPAALSTITAMFHGAERNRALGVWAAIGGSGAAIGVLMGGLLTSGPGWAWVFFVNVPVGVMLLAVISWVVPARPARPARVDLPGALLVTISSGLLVFGLNRAGDDGWDSGWTLGTIGAALVGYAAFVVVERVVPAPLMHVVMFTRRPVQSGTFTMVFATGLLSSFFFLSSLYLQHVRDFSALRTGLVFLPVAIVIIAGAHLAGRLIGAVGGRPVAVAGFSLMAGGAVLLAQVSVDSNAYGSVLPGLMVASLGVGPTFVTATTTTLGNVAQHESGLASAVINTAHELGGAIGVSVVSAVAASSIASMVPDADGFRSAFVVCAIAAAAAALVTSRLVPPGKPARAAVGHGHGH
ncbi:MFS transporter [Phytoactinopolyspora endophytica]|uniref:MFS transporter n=1 Tax=Phytoactinopolyspora endophytica TaxID=1642495 RepID=UPI00101CE5B2|nr:MFS transporter [Phytoactinopolyspora endophytica]